MQAFAHADHRLRRLVDYVRSHAGRNRALCIYSGDAEISIPA